MKISKKAEKKPNWEELIPHIRKVSRFDALQVPCSTDDCKTGMKNETLAAGKMEATGLLSMPICDITENPCWQGPKKLL